MPPTPRCSANRPGPRAVRRGPRLRRRDRADGQSLVEFSLVLTPLFLLLLGIIQFGFIFNTYVTVTNAAREAARVGTIYVYDRTATNVVNDAARNDEIQDALLASLNGLTKTAPNFTNGTSLDLGDERDDDDLHQRRHHRHLLAAGRGHRQRSAGRVSRHGQGDLPPGPRHPADRQPAAPRFGWPPVARRRSHHGRQLAMPATVQRSRSARERGQVLVIFILAVVALLAAAGLAIDIGRFYSERRFLQNGADAAALAAGSVLVRGGTETEARAEAMAVLADNFSIPPNGIVPPLPPGDGNEVYDSGFAGDPTHLISGILFSGGSVRVGIRNTIPYTFGRAVGLDSNMIVAQARVKFDGDLLPIAVREFVKAPGDSTGVAPCSDNSNAFTDYFATASTSCLGTDTIRTGRLDPNPGSAFNASTPDDDRTNHGPILAILGQGADPDNGSDFRGFIALDIRNFESCLVAALLQRGDLVHERADAQGHAVGMDPGRRLPGPDVPIRDQPTGSQRPGRDHERQLSRPSGDRLRQPLCSGRRDPGRGVPGDHDADPGLLAVQPGNRRHCEQRHDRQRRVVQGLSQQGIQRPGHAVDRRGRRRSEQPTRAGHDAQRP